MYPIKITLKNYRCFSDQNPLRFEIRRGFTALIGINNSGKSSLLRMFHELRSMWNNLRSNVQHIANEQPFGVNYLNIADPSAIFFDDNDRPLQLEIEHTGKAPGSLRPITKIVGTAQRSEPTNWRFHAFSGSEKIAPSAVSGTTSGPLGIATSAGNFDVSQMADALDHLSNVLYVAPYRNAINQGSADYYDLAVGESFIKLWNTWKTGGLRHSSLAIQRITTDIERIFRYERLEINASESRRTLTLVVDGRPYELSELGAGLAQFIIVLANAAIKRPSFILIDEPELNLHPALQLEFLTSLSSYASQGTIFATHSIGLAKTAAEEIYSIQRKGHHSAAQPYFQTSNLAELLGELSFSAHKELGCDQVLLVEGVSDVLAIKQLLSKLLKGHRVVIVPLGGSEMIRGDREHELAELRGLAKQIFAVIDRETSSSDDVLPDRAAFIDVCDRLGVKAHMTYRRAIENYFSDRAVKASLGGSFTALSPYQELKQARNGWRKADNWRIARQMERAEIEETDVGQFLSGL